MIAPDRERKALEAYFNLLKSKGADDENLAHRSTLLDKLLPLLTGQPAEGWFYRDVVDDVFQLTDRSEWPFFLVLTREYFHFWMDDIKAIATLHAGGGFEVEPPVSVQTEEKLKRIWQRLDSEKFSVAEMWPLKAYSAALREEGAEKAVVETRQKLVKLLLVQLREVDEKNGKIYRGKIESMLPLFVMKETRYLFLAVVREFYHFWMGDPDAASYIQLERSN
jgi:hypothetical protein